MTPKEAYFKAFNSGKKLPELELIIQQDAEWACYYAVNVIKGRWSEAESTILQDAEWAYIYSREVINGRWPEAEETIQKDARLAYYYAKHIIKGYWPEAEPVIAQHAEVACAYAENVIQGRWSDAEPVIAQSDYESDYISHFFSEPVVSKDQYSELEWARAGAIGYFAPKRLFERKESLIDMMIENMSQC